MNHQDLRVSLSPFRSLSCISFIFVSKFSLRRVSGSESTSTTSTVAFTARLDDDDDDDDDLGVDDDWAIWTETACCENLEYEPTVRPCWVETTGIKAKTETFFWIWNDNNWPSKTRNAQRILHPYNSVKGLDLVLDVVL
jgi:hypothetical protein